MNILTALVTTELIIAVLAPVAAFLYTRYIKKDYKKEFGTFAKIVEVIADRHNISIIDTLQMILEESGKSVENTKDIEEAVKKELDDIKKQ